MIEAVPASIYKYRDKLTEVGGVLEQDLNYDEYYCLIIVSISVM